MPGTTPAEWLEQCKCLVNDFAAQAVLAGEAETGRDRPAWLAALDELASGAGAPNRPSLAAEAASLRTELLALPAGSRTFFDAVEAGVERLHKSLENSNPAAATVPAASIAHDPELIADFIVESRDHLRTIEQIVLALEHDCTLTDPIHAMFRAFHTIKGIAGFLECHAICDVAHETETLLDRARNGKVTLTPPVIDVILASADYLNRDLNRIESGGPDVPAPTAELIARIRAAGKGGETRVEDDLKSISDALSAADANAPARRQGAPVRSIRVDTAKLDFLVDAIGEMVIAQSLIRHNPDLAKVQSAALMRNVVQLTRITGEVQKTAMSMRMTPIGTLFRKMTRLVRDLCRRFGKQAEVITFGDDTELDRNIVEELADPLMHMLRNALDHGVEMPDRRIASGKPATARVELRAAHHGGHIVIEIADDGRGIDREAVLRKAAQQGLIQAGADLSDNDIFALIFEPGFSTAERITEISGRGVGMDVVKKHIQKLRGTIETTSTPGKGTTFRLKLPLTLAIIDGLVVGVGSERYIVPIFAVKEMLRPTPGMVSTIEGAREIALIRDRVLPVVRLYRKFGIQPATEDPLESLLVVAESQATEFCLMVDKLIGKQEVVIKSLGERLQDIPGVAGGAILGDGRVALILEMNAIFHCARAA